MNGNIWLNYIHIRVIFMRSNNVISSLLATSGQQSQDGGFSRESMEEFSEANLQKMLNSKFGNKRKILDDIRNCPSQSFTINSLLINNLSKEEEDELQKAIAENKNLKCLTISDTTGKLTPAIMKGVAANPCITALDFLLQLTQVSAEIVLKELKALSPRKICVTFTDIFSITSHVHDLIEEIKSINAPEPAISSEMQRFIASIQYVTPTVLIDHVALSNKNTFSQEELDGIVSALAHNKNASILKFAAPQTLIPSVIEGVSQNPQIKTIDVSGINIDNKDTLKCILAEIQKKLCTREINIKFDPKLQREFFDDYIKSAPIEEEVLAEEPQTTLSHNLPKIELLRLQ